MSNSDNPVYDGAKDTPISPRHETSPKFAEDWGEAPDVDQEDSPGDVFEREQEDDDEDEETVSSAFFS